MEVYMRKRVLFASTIVLTLSMALITPDVSACWYCRQSPNGWGLCRGGIDRGYEYCTEIVVDEFSGKTGCDLQGKDCGIRDPLGAVAQWAGIEISELNVY
jgi:hypothetical protein